MNKLLGITISSTYLLLFFHNTVNQKSGSIFHIQTLWHSITTPYDACKNNNLHQRQWLGSSLPNLRSWQKPTYFLSFCCCCGVLFFCLGIFGVFWFCFCFDSCDIIGPCGIDSGLEDVKPDFSDGAIMQLCAAADNDNAECGSVPYTDSEVGFQHLIPQRKQLLLLGLVRSVFTNLKDF